tara:strand:- start:449 stop:1405 length:957 start_codon:yes stop_codon:yes gene_type:complete
LKSFSKYSIGSELKNKLLIPLNLILSPIEKLYLKQSNENFLKKFPPVFIIGSPRSGTTILYQLLCKHFNFGFINNFVSDWYRVPIVATSFYKKFLEGQDSISLESRFGQSKDLYGPNEFGKFWYQWFDDFHNPKKPIVSIIDEIRLEVSGLTRVHKKSILFKNVVNSMRVVSINKIFNNSVFIVINRDELDTAQSILNARIRLYNNKNHLWSVVPPSVNDLAFDEPYWKQIVQQIRGIYSNINFAKEAIGGKKFIYVKYKDLCNNTSAVLKSIKNELNKKGIEVSADKSFPSDLYFSTGKKVSDSDYELLKNEIKNSD